MAGQALPVVKQCNTIGDWQFGATATAAGANRWLVANPDNGGHWATDDDVADWAELASPDTVNPPSPEPEPSPEPNAPVSEEVSK